MKHLMIFGVTLFLLGSSCSRNDADSVDPTEPPALQVSLDGAHQWLVHLRADGLYATALDGSNERRLNAPTSVMPGSATYAGYVPGGGKHWVYATDVVERPGAGERDAAFAVGRTSLTSGEYEEVLRFPAPLTVVGSGLFNSASVTAGWFSNRVRRY